MKNNNLRLSISNPCLERWENMSATSQGAFCQQCQKEVIDFSKLSDNQIIDYFNNHKGSTCGKVKQKQLNRVINPSVQNSSFQQSSFNLFLGLFISTFWNNSVLAKPSVFHNQKPNTFIAENKLLNIYEAKKDSSKNVIKGKVLDKETNEPIPFANVFIKDIGIGVSSDLDGNFSLAIPDSISKNSFTLKIGSVGYNSLEINNITMQNNIIENTYYLKESESVILGLIIQNEPKKKKWWQRKHK